MVDDKRLLARRISPERQSRKHPEDLVADVGLQAVDGQDDAALRAQQRLQPLGIGRGQGPQLVVAVQEVGDGALGEDDPAAGQFVVDLGDAAVLGIAEPADQGHDVEAELVIGQGEVGLGLGAVGPEEAGAIGIGAASDGQGQPEDAVEGGDGAEVVVVGIGPVLAFGAVEGTGRGSERGRVAVVVVVACAWGASLEVFLRPLYAAKGSPATFATLVFFNPFGLSLHFPRTVSLMRLGA